MTNDDEKKNNGKVIAFERSKRQGASKNEPLNWKIRYQIQSPPASKKQKSSREQLWFWAKFVAYICLVTYGLKQCGY